MSDGSDRMNDTRFSDGSLLQFDDREVLQYDRLLRHSIDQVWTVLTDPEELAMWLAEAEIDLVDGGSVELRWLNTDADGNRAVLHGTITQLQPPHLLELESDIHGILRWELEEDGDGCRLAFSSVVSPALFRAWDDPNWGRASVLAGWHVHLDFLEDALEGRPVDWSNWPYERWRALQSHYLELFPGPG